jgi:hypothetical protein
LTIHTLLQKKKKKKFRQIKFNRIYLIKGQFMNQAASKPEEVQGALLSSVSNGI